MLKMPRKRSSRINTRANSHQTATKVPCGDSSSEDTGPSKPADMVPRLSRKTRQKENKRRCKDHVKADDSSHHESMSSYDGDCESASQSECATLPPQQDVEMKSDQDRTCSPESDSSSSAERKLTRRQKPRKKGRAAVQKTLTGGVLSPSRRHITGNTPQEEVFTLEIDPSAKSSTKGAVKDSTGNSPLYQHKLMKKEAYNSAISPPLVGIKPLNASDTSTPSVDARGSATCSFMDDSAFGFGALEEFSSIPPIELVVSPVKEVSPLVNVRPRRQRAAKAMPPSSVSDVSRSSPSKLSPSLEHKLRLTQAHEGRRSTRQSARFSKSAQKAFSSSTVSPSSPQTTASSHVSLEASTSLFKKPTASANTTDQLLERSVKGSVTSPTATATSPDSSMSSLVSPHKRKVPPGMYDMPIPDKEKKKRRKVHKKTKEEMEEWAAHMNAEFNKIDSFELEVE
ncbi:sororin-B-like isoform X1 [Branchiostoma floridae]|uniref:Sororin-B-like isoform X1 n=1 Tax=Branchiostoma floridae TaxID=7739 RepID=C3ZXE8_BRAFL|nr:sororin-B-like isoform X1 [Branchiostoma floridae]|eukprot:XP_002586762.1 hypothetical protein BRAFLDRAFT_122857 [Branchiostoma floridae]